MNNNVSRRGFMRFLSGSPLLAPLVWSWNAGSLHGDEIEALSHNLDSLIDAPEKAINVFDFEPVARAKLPPAHYGYLATGVEGDRTLRANQEGFSKIYLRPKRLVDVSTIENQMAPAMTWEFVDRLKSQTRMKVLLKGIVTREDARQCLQHGVDGIIVSNHGGRSEESGRPSIESLVEVVEAIDKKIPVLVDGGIRRGSDIFKALALGADAIAIGRPYLWGLAAFGQPGVEIVLKLLRVELHNAMMIAGTPSLSAISRKHIAML